LINQIPNLQFYSTEYREKPDKGSDTKNPVHHQENASPETQFPIIL